MPLSTEQKEWFDTQIKSCDPTGSLVTIDMDFVIYDEDGLPYALIELKPHNLYSRKGYKEKTIKRQLFAVAPLEKNPRLLVYGTIKPAGKLE